MTKKGSKSLTNSSADICWKTYVKVIISLLIFATVAFLSKGCATTKIPPIKTYHEAKKEADAQGPYVDKPVEQREDLKKGKSVPVLKDGKAPFNGILLDEDKTKLQIAVKAERDRLRKELDAARRSHKIQKIILGSTVDNLRAQAAARSTWWDKNKGLVGFILGSVIGGSVVVGLLYAVTGGKGATVTAPMVLRKQVLPGR